MKIEMKKPITETMTKQIFDIHNHPVSCFFVVFIVFFSFFGGIAVFRINAFFESMDLFIYLFIYLLITAVPREATERCQSFIKIHECFYLSLCRDCLLLAHKIDKTLKGLLHAIRWLQKCALL